MAIKLGTMLVQEGLISLQQLDEALKYQTIFGGRLGTNLIEMGVAEEEDIARVLSEKLRVPFTGSEELLNIPAELVRLIPRKIAQKYKVVPLRQEKKRLYLAMVDPSDLRAVDEIGFISGYAIHPLVAPEVSLILALEKHYGIDRDVRYVPVIKQILKKNPPTKKTGSSGSSTASISPARTNDPSWRENISRYAIDELSQALADVRERDQIAPLVLKYIGRTFDKSALFLIRDGMAHGWQARINGKKVPDFDHFHISLNDSSILKTVVETGSFYLGTPPDTTENNRLLEELQNLPPETTLLIPWVKQGRVICILYVTGQPSMLTGEFFDLQKLTQKATLALDILILRNKIMMT